MVPDQFGALGMLKAMQKNSIKFYPVIGWNFWFCENIFLARDAKRDIAAIETGIECLAKSKDCVFLFISLQIIRLRNINIIERFPSG